MRSAESASLCDFIEIGVLQLGKGMSVEDIAAQMMLGVEKDEANRLAREALGVAMLRQKSCPKGYPFESTLNFINPKWNRDFDPYVFLLLGYTLKAASVPGRDKLVYRFSRYFEDLVCWSLQISGFTACVFSEPRQERGLPKSLGDALVHVANLFGEPASIFSERIKPHDNDLDVDVVASPIIIDRSRCGGISLFLQCTTSPVERLKVKMIEGYNLFSSVWRNAFFEATSIRGGATPEDLLTLDSVDWGRLSQTGWVLDRMRLIELLNSTNLYPRALPNTVKDLFGDLKDILPSFDWRNDWRSSN